MWQKKALELQAMPPLHAATTLRAMRPGEVAAVVCSGALTSVEGAALLHTMASVVPAAVTTAEEAAQFAESLAAAKRRAAAAREKAMAREE